jgi:glutaminyl-peptide cyclotransferase
MAFLSFQSMKLLLYAFLALHVTAWTPLSDESLSNLPLAGADFDIKTGDILSPILIPRVPGTRGKIPVQQIFVLCFTAHLPNWTLEFHNST